MPHPKDSISIETGLRIRPLSRKEKEDLVVLEPIHSDDGEPPAVVLHPSIQKTANVTPSSALVRETLSPSAIQKGSDKEFRFNHVLIADDDQDKTYFTVGLPMALSAMESIKTGHDSDRHNHVHVAVGSTGSGKTYSSIGDLPLKLKRKSDTDGLAPRVVESMFAQSKHHVTKKSHSFAVQVSVVEVVQPLKGTGMCEVIDLLRQASLKSSSAGASHALSVASVGASLAMKKIVSQFDRSVSTSTTGTSSSTGSLVSIEHDPDSGDFVVANRQTQLCHTPDDFRAVMNQALPSRRSGKDCLRHMVVELQPLRLKHGQVRNRGGNIAFVEVSTAKHAAGPSRTGGSSNMKESVPKASDAFRSLIHCIRTIQQNQEQNIDQRESMGKSLSEKHIPYQQHKLMMLLQPILSANKSKKVSMTLFLHAYMGHRDYDEKKSLLVELERVTRITGPCTCVATGLEDKIPQPIVEAPAAALVDMKRSYKVETKILRERAASDVIAPLPGIPNAASMTYSECSEEDVVPLPPPMNPTYVPDECGKMALARAIPVAWDSVRFVSSVDCEADPSPTSELTDPSTHVSSSFAAQESTSEISLPTDDVQIDEHVGGTGVAEPRTGDEAVLKPLDNAGLRCPSSIGKVLKASHKKSKQLLNNMSILGNATVKCVDERGSRVLELEKELKVVKEEMRRLEAENQLLKQQIDRDQGPVRKLSGGGCESFDDSESLSDNCSRPGSSPSDENKVSSEESIFQDDLMQHLAALAMNN